MVKVPTSVYLEIEIKEHILNNPEIESLSQWVRDRYVKEFMQVEKRTAKLQKEIKKIEHIKKEIKRLKAEQKTLLKKLPKEAILWLEHKGKKRARKYSEEGVYKYFLSKYDLQNKINRRQFKILLNKK